jgi:CBS-domain-containing membrane protein
MPKTVADIMNPKLLCLRDGDPLSLARSQIVKFGVTAAPVVDETHRPVSVLSLRDLFTQTGETLQATAPVRCVAANASVADGARAIAASDVHHLVVVDENGVAVGMVSAVDFMRALTGEPARHADALAAY